QRRASETVARGVADAPSSQLATCSRSSSARSMQLSGAQGRRHYGLDLQNQLTPTRKELFMSLHVFANFVTPFGTAANNRAETEGNTTTLQKLFWRGDTHSTVSAEAIRFALRRRFATLEKQGTNRTWNDDLRRNEWQSGREVDAEFAKWA